MSYNRNETITGPARGTTRALTVTTDQNTYDLEEIFPTAWKDGHYITLSCNQVFYVQFSYTEGDTVNIDEEIADDSDVGEEHDEHAGGPFAANTPHRVLVPGDRENGLYKYLHVIAAGVGILRVWKSSSNIV